MDHQILEFIHSYFQESCSLNLLTNVELVKFLFSFCTKENEKGCKQLLSQTVQYYKKTCEPLRQRILINITGRVVHEQVLGIACVYLKISYKALERQLQKAFRVKRHQPSLKMNMTHEKFVGPTLTWIEDDGSMKLSTYIKTIIEMRAENDESLFSEDMMRIVGTHRGKPVYAEGQEVIFRKLENNYYIFVPILNDDPTKFDKFIKVKLSLLVDDFFLKDMNSNDQALHRFERMQLSQVKKV